MSGIGKTFSLRMEEKNRARVVCRTCERSALSLHDRFAISYNTMHALNYSDMRSILEFLQAHLHGGSKSALDHWMILYPDAASIAKDRAKTIWNEMLADIWVSKSGNMVSPKPTLENDL
jgi:hypothetical protein